MKRLLTAVAGGILIPVLYTTAVLLGYALIAGSADIMMDWNARSVPKLIFAPTMLPVYFYAFLSEHNYFGLQVALDNPWFRITFFFLFNLVTYSLITHAILRKLGWLESRGSKSASDSLPFRKA